jgi:hypothetical protein
MGSKEVSAYLSTQQQSEDLNFHLKARRDRVWQTEAGIKGQAVANSTIQAIAYNVPTRLGETDLEHDPEIGHRFSEKIMLSQ